ncbi:MAG TPA: NADH-quinone oxidoreductase subunit J [Candidatus Binatia bacterium]|nr:NADH-quinone oxidoreductase subunit J [Candidatus Binatia bacterium]
MIVFYLLAILSVLSAIVVVVHRSPIYCALALVNTLFLIAVMFVLLDAHMIAFLQVIVYAGAIMVLFLFVIMLLGSPDEPASAERPGLRTVVLAAAVVLAVELGAVVAAKPGGEPMAEPPSYGSTQALAERLFTTHLLSFELTSLLLLVAVVGAVVMARRRA